MVKLNNEFYTFMVHCVFKHTVTIHESLLGKTIPFKINGFENWNCWLLFPHLKIAGQKDGFNVYQIVSPTSFKLFAFDGLGKWGEVRNLIKDGSGTEYYLPCIKGVAVLLQSKDEFEDTKYIKNFIQEKACTFFTALLFKHPKSFIDGFSHADYFIDTSSFTVLQPHTLKSRPTFEVNANIIIHRHQLEQYKLAPQTFFYLFRNLTKDISLQYELLAELVRSKNEHNFRSSVLHGAMIIETTMKREVDKYLELVGCDELVQEHIRKEMRSGYVRITKIMKDFGIPFPLANECKETIEKRNGIMHGGAKATLYDAEVAHKIAEKVLRHYNIPYFS